MKLTADKIIKLLDLQPLSFEGGYFRETYRSELIIHHNALPDRYTEDKSVSTAIYYFLTTERKSVMHRIPTDEVFHFYLGDTVEMLLLYEDGTAEVKYLGTDIKDGQSPQIIVPRNTWQGARVIKGGEFALMGTTVSPGFDFPDLEIGDFEKLAQAFPEYINLIKELT